jgi:uncharacterized membrane protein YesL
MMIGRIMMKIAFKVFYRGFYDSYKHLSFTVWTSLFWYLSVLSIISIGPSTAALFHVIKMKQKGNRVDFKDFWLAIKSYGGRSITLFGFYIFFVLPAIIYVLYLYSFEQLWVKVGSVFLIYLLVICHLTYLFLFALMVNLNHVKITDLLKKAYRLVIDHVVFSLQILVILLLIVMVSIFLPFFLFILPGWIAISLNYALTYLLRKYNGEANEVDLSVDWKGVWNSWRNN